MRRSRKNHRARFLPTVVRGCRTFTYHADGQLASASCDGIGRAGAHASSDIASQCSLRSGDMRTPPSPDTQWRKSESLSHIAIINGDVWLTQTNIVSCSDSSIAPLVSSSARQLTGRTAALPSRSRTADVRGNVTENETLVDSALVTSRQTLPYATNKTLSLSRYGVSLMDVSVSAVTNTIAYDSLGRQIATTDGRGNTRQTEYNSLGQRSASIDALGNRTTYAYDQFGNLASVTDPLGNAIVYEYDLRGNKTYEGGATYPVRYTYDIFGNKTTMTTYRDVGGSQSSATAPQGDVTTWLYDIASGSMTNKVYADGKGPTYSYTPNAKLSQRTWARGITTDFSYDNWGSLTNTVYSDGTPTISLSYDALGRQTEARDAAGVTTSLYDSFGSLTNETVVGVAGTNTIIRHWDNYGRTTGYSLVGRVVPNEPQRQSTLAYDPATGLLASMLAAGSETPFAWNYLDGCDLKSSLAYPNGLTASWQYDANNQLLQACNAFPTNILSRYDYAYDVAGRRVACGKSGSAFAQNDTLSYGYNNRSELTNAVAAVDSDYRYAYDFDNIGNRETSSERGTNSVYTANSLNQYTAVDEFTPQFDDDGNQTLIKTSTGVWQVQYNGENRPILWENVSTNSPTHNSSTPTLISMSYDRMGRRVTKNDQRFVFDGYLQIANFEHQTSNIKLHTFVWDPTEKIETRPLVWNSSTIQPFNFSTSYYVHDGNKNVSEVVAANGDIAAHYLYAPFGARTVTCGVSAAANPWRFSSEYAEDDTATVYYNYRHYEPETGRWMSRDPSGEQRFQSLMSFILNSPISCFDLYGLECKKVNGTGVDLTASGSFYAGFGGSISISVSSMVYNCCCDGRIRSSDAYDVSITISGSVGLGTGVRVNLPVIGSIGMEFLGPQFTVSGGTSYSKECGDEEPEFSVTLVDVSGDIGVSVAIGSMFGFSLSYWAKYSISVIGEIHGRQAEFSVKYGWHGGGVWTINTPAGNINKEFWLFDGQEELGETPITVEW